MTVALIVPVHNQLELLEPVVPLLAPQVDQLILVDDASTDGTNDYLGTRWMDTPVGPGEVHSTLLVERGRVGAINAGMQHVSQTMDWVGWYDVTAAYPEGYVTGLLSCADENTGAVYGGTTRYDPEALVAGEDYMGPAAFIRRDLWHRAGAHRWGAAHRYDHWLRVEEVCWGQRKWIRCAVPTVEPSPSSLPGPSPQQLEAAQAEAIRRREQYPLRKPLLDSRQA